MLSSAQTLAPKPALPPAAPQAASAPSASLAGGPSFAQFLTEQASPPAPAVQPESDASEAGTEQTQSAKANGAARRLAQPPAKPAAQNRANEATPKADAKAGPTDKADTAPTSEAVAGTADEDDTPATPELKEFTQLLGMAPPAPDAAAARPDGHRPRAAATDDAATGRTDKRAAADAGPAVEATEPAQSKAADLRTDKAAAARAASSEPLQATASQPEAAHAPAAPTATAAPSFAAALAQAMPTPTAPVDAAPAPTYAAVQSPLHSPEFASEVGARISLLAVDGIQQAELQLNPADMGPVAVQITVDGNQAQVSFHALQAETRQALEQSLPDLAAALQGQGLTLSGGGVFQQAARDADHGQDDRRGEGAERGSRAVGGPAGSGSAATSAPVRRSVGLLDTFA
jgi:flagellar hook-length control protein FliK